MKIPAFSIKIDLQTEFLLDFLKYQLDRIFKTHYSISRNNLAYPLGLLTTCLPNVFANSPNSWFKNLIFNKKLELTYSSQIDHQNSSRFNHSQLENEIKVHGFPMHLFQLKSCQFINQSASARTKPIKVMHIV